MNCPNCQRPSKLRDLESQVEALKMKQADLERAEAEGEAKERGAA